MKTRLHAVRYFHIWLMLGYLAWGCGAHTVSGQDTHATAYTQSAQTTPKGSGSFSIQLQHLSNQSINDRIILSALQKGINHLHQVEGLTISTLAFSYGVDHDTSFALSIPFLRRYGIRVGEIEDQTVQIHPHNNIIGIGDVSVQLKHQLLSEAKNNIAIILGLEAPTGGYKNKEEEPNEGDLQTGSGSWDFIGGVAYTYARKDFSIHSDIHYKHNTKGKNRFTLGDVLTYNLAYSFILRSKRHYHRLHHKHTFQNDQRENQTALFFELNGILTKKDRFADQIVENTGYHILYATAGANFGVERDTLFFVSLSHPVMQEHNGIQNTASFRVKLGISKSFKGSLF